MAVAAAEVAVGLAILVSVFRNIGNIDSQIVLEEIKYSTRIVI